jgi:hypothetical protein
MRSAIIVVGLSCVLAPLNTAWSQAKLDQEKALPAVKRGTPSKAGNLKVSKPGELKAGIQAGGAPGTALAEQFAGEIATSKGIATSKTTTAPITPKRHAKVRTIPSKP